MAYDLKLHREVEKQLLRIPKAQRERLIQTMRSLRENPRPAGCEKLEKELYRVRVGQYRILHAVFDQHRTVVVCKVARRTEATYRDLRALLDRASKLIEE